MIDNTNHICLYQNVARSCALDMYLALCVVAGDVRFVYMAVGVEVAAGAYDMLHCTLTIQLFIYMFHIHI